MAQAMIKSIPVYQLSPSKNIHPVFDPYIHRGCFLKVIFFPVDRTSACAFFGI